VHRWCPSTHKQGKHQQLHNINLRRATARASKAFHAKTKARASKAFHAKTKAFHAKTPLESKNPEKVQQSVEMDGEAIQGKKLTW